MILLVNLLVVVLVLGAVVYIITLLPLPEPWKTIAMVIVGVIFIVVLLSWVVGPMIYGGGPILLR
jgi:hypothetical protein